MQINQKIYNAEFDTPADLRAYVSDLLIQELLEELAHLAPSKKKIAIDSFLRSIPNIGVIPIGQLITTSRNIQELIEYKRSWLALFLKLRKGGI